MCVVCTCDYRRPPSSKSECIKVAFLNALLVAYVCQTGKENFT